MFFCHENAVTFGHRFGARNSEIHMFANPAYRVTHFLGNDGFKDPPVNFFSKIFFLRTLFLTIFLDSLAEKNISYLDFIVVFLTSDPVFFSLKWPTMFHSVPLWSMTVHAGPNRSKIQKKKNYEKLPKIRKNARMAIVFRGPMWTDVDHCGPLWITVEHCWPF